MAQRIDISEDALIQDCENGLLQSEMARKYNVSKTTISQKIKLYGIKYTPRSQNPRYSALMSQASNKMWDNQELRQQTGNRAKQRWATEQYREKIQETYQKTDYAKRQGEISKLAWQDDKYRNHLVLLFTSNEFRNKQRQKSNDWWNDPNRRQQASKRTKQNWTNEEFQHKVAVGQSKVPRTMTTPHRQVCNLLDAMGIEYQTEVPIAKYRFDILIPSHKLFIETQGDYWHGEKKNVIWRDRAKGSYIANNFPQYRYKELWEHECETEDYVRHKLEYWLGAKINLKDYNFDDIQIKTVDRDVASKFIRDWHYLHKGRFGLDIGGFISDQLVVLTRFTSVTRLEMATTIGYHHKEVLELSRLCIHPAYQKKNLGSWFLSRVEGVIRHLRPDIKCLVSFADMTYGHTGAVYKASNWQLISETKPDYWYVKEDGWVMHKKTLWNKAKDVGLTENDFAARFGYVKVWGKEKFKFIKKL